MIPVWLDDAKERAHDPRPHDGTRRPLWFPIEEVARIQVALERDWIMAGCKCEWSVSLDLWARLQEWRV